MSKAFTRESDEAPVEGPLSIRARVPPGVRNYITQKGAERLKEQLTELVQKKAATNQSSGASSNPEQANLDTAVKNLQQILDSVVIAQAPADPQKVAFGASVTVRYENGEEEFFQIVGIDEAEPENGAISWISPLARALVSHRVGDKIRFRAPESDREMIIVAVNYGDR